VTAAGSHEETTEGKNPTRRNAEEGAGASNGPLSPLDG